MSGAGGQAAGLAAAARVGQAQAGAQAAAPAAEAAPKMDRYKDKLKELQRNAAFGVFIPDLLEAQSGGRDNIQRGIKLAIRRQYFNTLQVQRLSVTMVVVGMCIAAGLYESTFCPAGLYKHLSSFVFGLATGAASLMIFWWLAGANWQSVCNRNNQYVDEDKVGAECLSNEDCTRGQARLKMCVQLAPDSAWRAIRNTFMAALVVVAVAFGIVANSSGMNGQAFFEGFAFGGVGGAAVWQLIPLEDHRKPLPDKKKRA
jgi:hypothetical protein